MKISSEATVDDPSLFGVEQFLKCPSCHRSGTVKLDQHPDCDITITCEACDSCAIGHKLHESMRTHGP